MLTFAKFANELIYITKETNETVVNILLGCVYEQVDIVNRNREPYYATASECSYLLSGRRDVAQEIQRGAGVDIVIDEAENYFSEKIVPYIIPGLLDDFLSEMKKIIEKDY